MIYVIAGFIFVFLVLLGNKNFRSLLVSCHDAWCFHLRESFLWECVPKDVWWEVIDLRAGLDGITWVSMNQMFVERGSIGREIKCSLYKFPEHMLWVFDPNLLSKNLKVCFLDSDDIDINHDDMINISYEFAEANFYSDLRRSLA